MITDKQKKVMIALKNPDVWKPSLRKINEITGIKQSTIHDILKRTINFFNVNIKYKTMDDLIKEGGKDD